MRKNFGKFFIFSILSDIYLIKTIVFNVFSKLCFLKLSFAPLCCLSVIYFILTKNYPLIPLNLCWLSITKHSRDRIVSNTDIISSNLLLIWLNKHTYTSSSCSYKAVCLSELIDRFFWKKSSVTLKCGSKYLGSKLL